MFRAKLLFSSFNSTNWAKREELFDVDAAIPTHLLAYVFLYERSHSALATAKPFPKIPSSISPTYTLFSLLHSSSFSSALFNCALIFQAQIFLFGRLQSTFRFPNFSTNLIFRRILKHDFPFFEH